MNLILRLLCSCMLMIGSQLHAIIIFPNNIKLSLNIGAEIPSAKPSGLYLDSFRINLVTKGQFRLLDNTPFYIKGDTFSKSIPVQDRFGNSCPKYYIRKTVLDKQNPVVNTITIFKERALIKGFIEYTITVPPFDSLRPILIIEKPRFGANGKTFRAKWITQAELYMMIWKDGIDTRHYHRETKKPKSKLHKIS